MEELSALCEANGMEAVAQIVQKRAAPEAGTLLGDGKLEEPSSYCQNLGAEAAIFDGELSGSQIRNLSERLDVEVLDRTMLILEIFRSRAVTNEGKVQTELAMLRYRLPRLQGLGESLSRQGGGGGGGGGARRGAGESKLEYRPPAHSPPHRSTGTKTGRTGKAPGREPPGPPEGRNARSSVWWATPTWASPAF